MLMGTSEKWNTLDFKSLIVLLGVSPLISYFASLYKTLKTKSDDEEEYDDDDDDDDDDDESFIASRE
jgi:hypothetical protein